MAGAPRGVGDLRVMMPCLVYCKLMRGEGISGRARKRKRLGEQKGARAHRGDQNRALISAGMTDSNEQIHAAQWLFDVIERGGLERVSRGFYRRSSLTRGLGFRENRTDERDAVFGSVSCSR
jgi:hypothetical protein